jgi:anti-sigma B factor antagonist
VRLADDATSGTFDVRIEHDLGQAAVIHFSGEMDVATAPRVEDAFALCGQSCDVIVDLTEVTFLDSTALKVLVINAKKLSGAGYQIRLQGLSDLQRRLLHITGLSAVLNVSSGS